MPPTTKLEIVGVYVGSTQKLGTTESGTPIYSSFKRKRVTVGRNIYLGYGGLAGDTPTDQRPIGEPPRPLHGGPLKAVYVFPGEHYEFWDTVSGEQLSNRRLHSDGAFFGENLRTLGILEDQVHIGDVWRWGETLVQVTGHRRPCYKLRAARGKEAPDWMKQTGRCGWYMQVIKKPGLVPVLGRGIEVIHSNPDAPTIASTFRTKMMAEPEIPGPFEEV